MYKPLGLTGIAVLAFIAVGCGSTATTGISSAAITPSVAATTAPAPTATPKPTAAPPVSGHVWTEYTNGTPPSGSACYVETVTSHPKGDSWCTPYDNAAAKPNIGPPPALSGHQCQAWAYVSPPGWYRLCA